MSAYNKRLLAKLEAGKVGGSFTGTPAEWAEVPPDQRHLFKAVLVQDFDGIDSDLLDDAADDDADRDDDF